MKIIKRYFAIVLVLCLSITYMCDKYVKAEEQGPIKIYTIADLYNIRNNMSGNFILMNDIDASEDTAEGGDYDYAGKGWDPIGSGGNYSANYFTGVFDGNGHKIKGLRINVSDYETGYFGLFASNEGEIKNIDVEINMTVSKVRTIYAGIICAVNNGTIIGCKTSGGLDLSAAQSGDGTHYACIYSGGIAGQSSNNISNSSNSATINNSATVGFNLTSQPRFSVCSGGIVGANYASISQCYNLGNVKFDYSDKFYESGSDSNLGGIAYSNSGAASINNCYNCGDISTKKGTVAGIDTGGYVVVKNCYNIGMTNGYGGTYDRSKNDSNVYYLSGTGSSIENNISLSSAQMKLEGSFAGFDFDNIWIIDSATEYKYPQLRNNRQVIDKEIDIIEWKTIPSKITYYTGDKINPAEGQFKVYYIDGTNETINVTADMLSGYDLSLVGNQTVTLSYRGNTLDYQILVEQKPDIVSVSQVSGPDKTEFVRGTQFDFTGWKLQVQYDNATSEIIDVNEEMTTGGNINASGTYEIKCVYGGKEFTSIIKVIPVQITGIKVTHLPSKTTYIEDEPLDISGMVVTAMYNDDTTKNITDYTVSGYSSQIGVHDVVVKYSDWETSFSVTVEEGIAIGLAVKKLPDKIQYVDGQQFDPKGLVVEATYKGGFSKPITDYSLSEMNPGVGSQNIIVSYQNVSTYFTISVIQKQLQSIEITRLPIKTIYVEDEPFISDGLVVSALYNDGTRSEINNYTLSGNVTTTVGEKIATVTYSGKTTSFSYSVIPAELTKITVEEPTKKEYLIDESLDLDDMIVTAVYSNGRTEEITDYYVSGYTGEVGTNVVIINYRDKTWAFTVEVHEPYGDWDVVKEGTCTETGERVKYCRVCGEVSLRETIPAKGHSEVIDKAVNATCTESGLTEGKHCAVCNKILVPQTVIEAKGHIPSLTWEIENHSSCTESGIQVKRCTVCRTILEARDIGATGHIVVLDKGRAATCTESGLTDGSHCSVCGETLVVQQSIEPLGHISTGKWVITKQPTCVLKGEKKECCSVCGETIKTELIDAKGHIPSEEWVVTHNSTCTQSGEKIKYCTVCQEEINREIIPALGHVYGSYHSNHDATCLLDGTKTAICARCGAENTVADKDSAKGHTIVVDEEIAPSCITEGRTEGSHCLYCGEIIVDTRVIPAKGHHIVDNAIKNSTCTEDGHKGGTHCDVCGESFERAEIIPALGHKKIKVNDITSSYFNTGYTGDEKCSLCGETITRGIAIPKLVLKKPAPKYKAGKKKIVIKYAKVKDASKYEIAILKGKKWSVIKTTKTKYTIKKLKKGKKYKVKVRAVVVGGDLKAYSSYSKIKKVKVK